MGAKNGWCVYYLPQISNALAKRNANPAHVVCTECVDEQRVVHDKISISGKSWINARYAQAESLRL